jgi:hypothetical protein
MYFDSELTWKQYVEYIQKKSKQRLNLMRKVSGRLFGASNRTLQAICRMLIRPILEYGSTALNSLSISVKQKLDSIQYNALRICTAASKGTAAEVLQNDCGEMPLGIKRTINQLKYAAKIKNDKKHPSKDVLEDHWMLHYGKYKDGQEPMASKVNKIFKNENWNDIDKKPQPKPPWQWEEKLHFDESLHDERLKKKTPETAAALTQSLIDKYAGRLIAYTDGSKSTSGRVAAAYYIPAGEVGQSFRLIDNCSIYTAELIAIQLALEKLITDQRGA